MCRSFEHRRRAVDGNHTRIGKQPGQLAHADAGTAADVDDPTHWRRIRITKLGDPRRRVGHEGDEYLAFQLGVGRLRCPVRFAQLNTSVLVISVLVVCTHVDQNRLKTRS